VVSLDEETLTQFERTLRGVLAASDDDRTDALEEAGWRDILTTDPRSVIPVMFRAQGELCARSAVLDDVALHSAVQGDVAPIDQLGEASFVHARPGARATAITGADLEVDGLAFRAPRNGQIVALVRDGDSESLAVAPAACFERSTIAGLDPTLGFTRTTGTAPAGEFTLHQVPDPGAADTACRRALSYELIGLSSAMLDVTAEYARTRVQFGKPIGAFQAVKHHLADVLVALNAARVAADESWDADAALAATVAKCLAGRAFRLAAENCLQVMGAIGFTLEHELHRFMWRGTVLEVLYGSARELRVAIGRALLGRGRVPRPGVL
jgi:hypothetical protein